MSNSIQFTRISSAFLNFKTGERIVMGEHLASYRLDLAEKRFRIKTFTQERAFDIEMLLDGPDFLSFRYLVQAPEEASATGRFLNTDYEEAVSETILPRKDLVINGTMTKLSANSGISTKVISQAAARELVGVVQERIEIISEDEFATTLSSGRFAL